MTPAQVAVLNFLNARKGRRFTAANIAHATGYATSTIREALNGLLVVRLVNRAATYDGELGWIVKS